MNRPAGTCPRGKWRSDQLAVRNEGRLVIIIVRNNYLIIFTFYRNYIMKQNKRIRIEKGIYLSVKQLRKIHKDLKEKKLEISKENILNQHYRLQTAHPFKRIVIGLIGLIFFLIGILNYLEIGILIFSLTVGLILVSAGIRGRKKEINVVVDLTTETVDVVGSVAEAVFEIISAIDF